MNHYDNPTEKHEQLLIEVTNDKTDDNSWEQAKLLKVLEEKYSHRYLVSRNFFKGEKLDVFLAKFGRVVNADKEFELKHTASGIVIEDIVQVAGSDHPVTGEQNVKARQFSECYGKVVDQTINGVQSAFRIQFASGCFSLPYYCLQKQYRLDPARYAYRGSLIYGKAKGLDRIYSVVAVVNYADKDYIVYDVEDTEKVDLQVSLASDFVMIDPVDLTKE